MPLNAAHRSAPLSGSASPAFAFSKENRVDDNVCEEGQRLSELFLLSTIELNKVGQSGSSFPNEKESASKNALQPLSSEAAKSAFNRAFMERMHHFRTCPICNRRRDV
jgi:hypothetical protein